MKRYLCLLALSAGFAVPAAFAASIVETYDFNGINMVIADGNPAGASDTQTIASNITSIESVRVSVDVDGTWNGDLYAYLTNGSGLAILLNRAGRTAANSFGFGDDGLSVTFDDTAATNIHDYQSQTVPSPGNPLLGDFQSDGRLINPDDVLDTDPVTAQLSVFAAQAASGDWTLFVADLAGGDQHTVQNWSLEVTGIPEPGSLSLLLLGAVGLLLRRKR